MKKIETTPNPSQHFLELWNKMTKTAGLEQKKVFLEYCKSLVDLVEKGEVREEDASYSMVGAFSIDGITGSTDLEPIIISAGIAEIPHQAKRPTETWGAVLEAIKQVEINLSKG